jgi:tetratricopeptide (TPR) repeat protein
MTEADLPPQQKNLWLKGVSACQLKNFDYAISLILSVVKQSPEFLEGRKLLRRAEAEKFKGQKKGLFGGVSLGGFKLGGGGKKEPWEAIAELEEGVFQKDPYNANANQQLYELALRLGQNDLAAFALETIREGHPENTRNMHALAHHYMAYEQPELASNVYQRREGCGREDIHDPPGMAGGRGLQESAQEQGRVQPVGEPQPPGHDARAAGCAPGTARGRL